MKRRRLSLVMNGESRAMSTESVPQDIDRNKVSQYGLGMIILMFAWPAAWFTLLIYVVGRQFIPVGGTTPTWLRLLIIVFGTGAELVAGLVLLRREGYRLTPGALRDRIRLRWPKGWKAWGLAAVVFVLGMSISMAMGPVNRVLASVPGFVPPAWWGAASNPTVKVSGAADVFPDITLTGNYAFVVLYIVIGLVFNIVGEEILYAEKSGSASAGMKFMSTGRDPIILLPERNLGPSSKVVVLIDLTVPCASEAQLFYQTKRERYYNEEKKLGRPVKKGRNLIPYYSPSPSEHRRTV